MIENSRSSFRTRLVLAAASTVVLIQLAGAVVDIYLNLSRLSAEMDARGALMVEQTASTIAGPLWDFDTVLVTEVLQNLSQTESFARVAVITPSGQIEQELTTPTLSDASKVRTYQHPIVVQDGYTNETLGTLELEVSTARMRDALDQVILNKLLLVFTIFLFTVGGLFIVLGRISKPLENLRRAVFAIERDDFDVPVPSQKRQDEIGALARALDGLREREAELSVLRRANTEKARRESKRILQALETTRDAVVLVDEKNTIVFTNKSAEIHFPDLSHGSKIVEQRTKSRSRADNIRRALLSRKETDTEISVKKGNKIRHFQARTGPIVDAAGNYLGGLFLASDFTEQVETSRRATYLASHDPLTGLMNRRQMDSILSDWIKDGDAHVGLMLMDLDHFKTINDTFGHQTGDRLLVEIAARFKTLSQDGDLVVRLGGDEFAIITRAPNCEDHLRDIARHALAGLKNPIRLGAQFVSTSISTGIATTALAKWDMDALMRHADLALYEAKKTGRGRTEIYKDALMATYDRRHLMEQRLTLALDGGGVFPVFQPQISSRDRQVVGFEALARWDDDDELGLVSPAEFIPLAEDTGLIQDLTRSILRDACKVAVEWRSLGFGHRISVNMSPRLFDGPVLDLVRSCLAEAECPPDLIELEITESVLLSHSGTVLQEIEALRTMGLTIALDDFGIGYSSLDYLRRFPVDKLKIDRAFVSNIAKSEQSRAIVTAMAQLGRSLGMTVIGEGAETEEDRHPLTGCGVDIVQGFVDGTPDIKSVTEDLFVTDMTPKRALG